MNKCNKPYTIMSASELDIDDLATIPDYFLGMRAIEDSSTGNTVITPVRVPGARVMPTGNLANVTALEANNTSLDIPSGQVLAGYIDVQPGGNVVRLADTSHSAMFLLVGNYTNGKVLIQENGYLNIQSGHAYIIGQQYYLGDNGEPVTDSTITGQKLFRPLDRYTISVNGDF